jgi:hypothetical protein
MQAAVIGVARVLGIGEKDICVPLSAFKRVQREARTASFSTSVRMDCWRSHPSSNDTAWDRLLVNRSRIFDQGPLV